VRAASGSREEAAAAVANGPWHGAQGKEGKEKSQRVRGQVCESSGEKKLVLGRKLSISIGLHPFPPPSALTRGSGVRGTAGPI